MEQGFAPVVVSSLVGRRQLDFAIPCLRSLVRASAEPIRLRVHDDGTLSETDVAAVEQALDPIEIVDRAAADARASTALRGHPRCAAFRAANPLGLKLVDLTLWGDGPILYCDADVLFVRRFAGVFSRAADRALFMSDRQNAYAVSPRHLWRLRELRLAARVNTGVVVAPRDLVDLDRIEWLLAQPDLRAPVWLEQTCWAMLGAGRCDLIDPEQFAIPRSAASAPPAGAVAVHFVSPVRSLLMRTLEAPTPLEEGVVPVRRRRAVDCTAASLVVEAIRRRLGLR